jgi:hypothetical protein
VNQSYFKQSFCILLLATLLFVGLKPYLPTRIFPEGKLSSPNIVVDSLMLEALAGKDIDEVLSKNVDTLSTKDIPKQSFTDTLKGNTLDNDNLQPFFRKLQQLESTGRGHIRIGYFGDSMTDGDYIVQDLRALFQETFGGSGVGFIPITSESAASRGSVRHTYSNNWKRESYVNVKRPTRPFGIAGQVFFVKSPTLTWVEYKASGQPHISQMYTPTLFYGSSGNTEGYIEIRYNGDTTRVIKPLIADKRLNTITLAQGNVKGLRINFFRADSIPIYGVNSTNVEGVHIDNFSSRGNSGLPLSLFNTKLMQDFDTALGNYDLIVLHFGANVLNYGTLDYSWYQRGMTKVINQLRTCFPEASFLIISTADKSSKYGMEMKTDTAVEPLSLAQQAYAKDTHSGFINLYKLMGGEGSMLKWVGANPPLAGKDYTHFNARGSKKVAQLLYKELIKEYLAFKNPKDTPEQIEQLMQASKDSLLHKGSITDFLKREEKE